MQASKSKGSTASSNEYESAFSEPSNAPSTQIGGLEENLKSFMSPYSNKPYYEYIPNSSFASGNAPPRPLYDIFRDPLIRDADYFIAEVAYLLAKCCRNVEAEDRVIDKRIGKAIPLYMRLCIEYIDKFHRITDRDVRYTLRSFQFMTLIS
jgi:hypothetical protein